MAGSSVERYVPQGQLAGRSEQELASVGFSPDFPARVQELNDGLARIAQHAFAGYRFTLEPDYEHPRVDVAALRHNFPFDIVINAFASKYANVSITSVKAGERRALAEITLPQLHSFTDTYPTAEPIRFSTSITKRDADPAAGVLPGDLSVNFNDLRSAEDLRKFGINPRRYTANLGFATREADLSMVLSGLDFGFRRPEPTLDINSFYARDTSANIETIIGNLGRLLGKNWNDRPQEDE